MATFRFPLHSRHLQNLLGEFQNLCVQCLWCTELQGWGKNVDTKIFCNFLSLPFLLLSHRFADRFKHRHRAMNKIWIVRLYYGMWFSFITIVFCNFWKLPHSIEHCNRCWEGLSHLYASADLFEVVYFHPSQTQQPQLFGDRIFLMGLMAGK